MAGELLSFGVQKLWDLLTNEYAQFQGVEDQVAELKSDLNLLRSFLKDAVAKKHASATVRNCVEEIKEIIMDAEDILETFLIKDGFAKSSGIKKHIRKIACNVSYRRKIAFDIEGISKRISKVIRDMHNFGVQQMIADGGMYSHSLNERKREMRQTFPMDRESDFVGLEENVKKIVGYLLEEDNTQVVSITGMGGLGKTTLARQVFNHEKVKKEFNGFAWVYVSQDFKRKDVWQIILQNLRPKEEENRILMMTEDTLHNELFQLLKASKTLIVLDDIWTKEAWDLIQCVFPAEKGCKVLLTSRNESVVKYGNTPCFNFKLECLTTEESWSLFQKITFSINDSPEFDDETENVAKQMIKHCGGLPLAIKVLGGLLVAQYTFHEWKRIGDNIKSHIIQGTSFNDGNSSSVYHILSLSFEELPGYLKHCFLYFAHFPEDHEINVEKLSYFWAAEEIPKPSYFNQARIRDVADFYIEDLVSRNMVIAKRDNITSRFETCRLHDMMRDMCLAKAREESFLQIVGIHSTTAKSQSCGSSRRFVSHNPKSLLVNRDMNNPKLRSLLSVFSSYRGDKCMLPGLSFKRLQLLRLLDLNKAKFEGGKLPDSIGKLIHLKYLSLKKAEVSYLPSSLRNLKLLIYLNIQVSAKQNIFLPNVLMEMRELIYLALPNYSVLDQYTKLEMSNLVNLETLINFSTKTSSLEDLQGMTRLRTLWIYLSDGKNIETLYASIGGFRFLENLTIEKDEIERKQEDGIVFDFNNLKELTVSGLYMSRLPDEQHFSSHLTTIFLRCCYLEEDPMPILEKLLQLKTVYLWDLSFSGKKMICSRSGFPQLQSIKLSDLEKLEEWIIEEGSMPVLRTVTILRCENLKELPEGLRFIYSLNNLKIEEKWKERMSERGEDYYKVQHIPYVTFIDYKK